MAQPPMMIGIWLDDRPIQISSLGSVAGALLEAGILRLRSSPRNGAPRGAFCFMGVCQECAILIDGRVQQACLVRPQAGMRISLMSDYDAGRQ